MKTQLATAPNGVRQGALLVALAVAVAVLAAAPPVAAVDEPLSVPRQEPPAYADSAAELATLGRRGRDVYESKPDYAKKLGLNSGDDQFGFEDELRALQGDRRRRGSPVSAEESETPDEAHPYRGRLVYLCKPGASGRCGHECDESIRDINLTQFKLGVVLSARTSTGTLRIATCRGWIPAGADGFPVGPHDPEENLYRLRECASTEVVNLNTPQLTSCMRDLTFRDGFVPEARGEKGLEAVMDAAAETIPAETEAGFSGSPGSGSFTEMLAATFGIDYKEEATLQAEAERGSTAAEHELLMFHTKQFLEQMQTDREVLMPLYDDYLKQWGLYQLKAAVVSSATLYDGLRHSHRDLAGIVRSLQVALARQSRVGDVEIGQCAPHSDDEESHRSMGEMFGDLGDARKERNEAKRQEYMEIMQGFGFFSVMLVAAAADVGLPGLGTVLQFSAVGGSLGLEAVKQLAASLSNGGAQALGGVGAALAQEMGGMGKVDELMELCASAAEAAKEEMTAEMSDAAKDVIRTRGMTISDLWKRAVQAIVQTAKVALPRAGLAAVDEGAWTAATLIPLLGPYVGMTRAVGSVLNQVKESRKAYKEYEDVKDQIYDSVLSLRDCGLRAAVTYAPMPVVATLALPEFSDEQPSGESPGAMQRQQLADRKAAVQRNIHLTEVDIVGLKGTIEAAVAAMHANSQMERQLLTVRAQEFLGWGRKERHESRVLRRISSKHHSHHVSASKWTKAFQDTVVSACEAFNNVYAGIGLSSQRMCCDPVEANCSAK